MKTKEITSEKLEKVLNTEFSDDLKDRISKHRMYYKKLSVKERDQYILNCFNVLNSDIEKAGKHRIDRWNDGWKENFDEFLTTGNINSLIPKYHGKHKYLHWKGDIIKPVTKNLDYYLHVILIDWVFEKYLSDVDNLFEFGCGPAYHLLRYKNVNSRAKLIGLDWAKSSQDIISLIREFGLNYNIKGYNFDFFNPDYSIDIPENSGIYTVAAIEQIGDKYGPFLDYLLEKKPKICVNIEPISEILDETKLIDKLSIEYFKKRNYLENYLNKLEELEKQNKIKIINKQRTYMGSEFIEGHSLVVWKII